MESSSNEKNIDYIVATQGITDAMETMRAKGIDYDTLKWKPGMNLEEKKWDEEGADTLLAPPQTATDNNDDSSLEEEYVNAACGSTTTPEYLKLVRFLLQGVANDPENQRLQRRLFGVTPYARSVDYQEYVYAPLDGGGGGVFTHSHSRRRTNQTMMRRNRGAQQSGVVQKGRYEC